MAYQDAHAAGAEDAHGHRPGFFTRVCDEEKGVLDGIKEYMRAIPAYDPMFFRVAEHLAEIDRKTAG